jgi:FixJ family two-component response regulator
MTHEPILCTVDDDEAVREALEGLLRSTGRRAVGFSSAEEFLASGVARAAGCLILDLRMPGIGGLELRRRLLADGCPIPTIILTAHGNDVVRAQALDTGVAAVLFKPFDPDVLLEAVRAAFPVGPADPGGQAGSDS